MKAAKASMRILPDGNVMVEGAQNLELGNVITRKALHDAVYTYRRGSYMHLHQQQFCIRPVGRCCNECTHFLVPADTPDNRRGDASVCECMLHPGCNNLRNWPFRNTKCMDWRYHLCIIEVTT